VLAGLSAAHNAARAQVGVAPLAWSPTLAGYAQQWADQLAEQGCALSHRPGDSYGENLFWTTVPRDAAYVVAQWTSEVANYVHLDADTFYDGVDTTHAQPGALDCGGQQRGILGCHAPCLPAD
jgi:uncharacterized protein YkwD